MPTYTKFFSLEKPAVSEKYDINVFNSNFEKIDTAVKDLIDQFTVISEDGGKVCLPVVLPDGTLVHVCTGASGDSIDALTELPTPSSDYENKCILYIGSSTSDIATNSFYQCILDSQTNTYVWQPLKINDSVDTITYTALAETSDITVTINVKS